MSFTNNFQKQSIFASCHQRVQNMDQDCYLQTIYRTIKLCKKSAENSVHGGRISQNIQALQSASREFSASIVSCCSQRIYRTIQVVSAASMEFIGAWRKAKGFCVETLLQQQCDEFCVCVYLLQSKSTKWG